MRGLLLLITALALAACQSDTPRAPAAVGNLTVDDLLSGGRMSGPNLEKAIRNAASHSLGSEQNPVRADMPLGQRAYLARLRCANAEAPQVERLGLLPTSPFGSLVDVFDVRCPGSTPARTQIAIDMYHPGHVEPLSPPGFTIVTP